MNRIILLLAVAALAGACKPPLHLSYDYGRAFVETLRVQADLTRPSVQYAGYSLYGPEAARIRLNVEEASTAKEEAVGELSADKGGK
jgi:hypothetical protein